MWEGVGGLAGGLARAPNTPPPPKEEEEGHRGTAFPFPISHSAIPLSRPMTTFPQWLGASSANNLSLKPQSSAHTGTCQPTHLLTFGHSRDWEVRRGCSPPHLMCEV